jgi:hypothetical protein
MLVLATYGPLRSLESYSLIGWIGAGFSSMGSVVALRPGMISLTGLPFTSVARTA